MTTDYPHNTKPVDRITHISACSPDGQLRGEGDAVTCVIELGVVLGSCAHGAGLTTRHRDSNHKVRRGSITKQGPVLVRWASKMTERSPPDKPSPKKVTTVARRANRGKWPAAQVGTAPKMVPRWPQGLEGRTETSDHAQPG